MANLIILIGLPGSGKSTYARQYVNDHLGKAVWRSSDVCRAQLYGDARIQGNPQKVFKKLHEEVKLALLRGFDVLYDATNVNRKSRKAAIQLGKDCGANIHAHIIWAPVETCVQRDSQRDRTVGYDVIKKMLYRFEAPYYDEGFDEIKIVYSEGEAFNDFAYTKEYIEKLRIPHDNPHHELDVDKHCLRAHDIVWNMTDDNSIRYATLWHDIGKPHTKFFKDGETVAHYYNHDNVGAYLSYGLDQVRREKVDPILVPWLISNHMQPYFNSAYYNNLTEELKNKIDLLHYADHNAH